VIQVQFTIEGGDIDFKLADLMKEVQDFLNDKDFEIISSFKIRKPKKRSKDVPEN